MKHIYFFIVFVLSTLTIKSQILVGQELFGAVPQERFGSAVDISDDGQVLALRTGLNSSNNYRVELYTLGNGTWVQKGSTINLNPVTFSFGTTIPIRLNADGSIVVIPSQTEENNNRVQIFEFQGNNWVQKGDDIFTNAMGPDVSIDINTDGTIVAIGSTLNNSAGSARVYRYENNLWMQIGQTINGEFGNDLLGWSIALNDLGNIFAVGAIGHDNGSGFGQVQVFENQNDNWIQIGSDIDGTVPSNSGWDVKMNAAGSFIAVGIPVNSEPNTGGGGIRLYQNNAGNWEQVGDEIFGSNPIIEFGQEIALNGDGTILAASVDRADDNGTDSGKVSIFQNQNNQWVEVGVILGDYANQFFGTSIDMSDDGTILAIGAPGVGSNLDEPGSVRVYDLSSLLTLSMNEQELINFSLFPNPTNENITIQLDKPSDLETINIYNSVGQHVLSSRESTINISRLASGLYIVEVITSKGKASKKLIIE